MCPGIDYLVVTLGVGDESHVIVLGNLAHFLVTLLHEGFLLLGDNDVVEVERKSGKVSHAVTEVLDTVEELASLCETYVLDHVGNDVAETLLGYYLIYISHLRGNDAVDDDTSHGCLHEVLPGIAVLVDVINHHLHLCVEVAAMLVMCDDGFLGTVECESLALCTRADLCDIVESKHHVL